MNEVSCMERYIKHQQLNWVEMRDLVRLKDFIFKEKVKDQVTYQKVNPIINKNRLEEILMS